MENVLKGYEPEKVWYYFNEISKIPRRSGNEKAIGDFLLKFADEKGFESRRDEYLNVVIKKPATKGYENAPAVILQGHLDMVCEKNKGIDFDFEKDPLNLMIEDGWLTADGTTLGADNGIAVAFALAVLDSNDLEHPAIEVVMTTDEEVGLTGALNMTTGDLKGKYFINLDSEEEGEITVSCAGGLKAYLEYPIEYDDVITDNRILMEVSVEGLLGGHSGVEIDQNRGNAIKILGRVLDEINTEMDMHLVDIYGGMKDNVIPREATAFVIIRDEDEDLFNEIIVQINEALKSEFISTDAGIKVNSEEINCESSINVLPRKQTDTVVFLINALPNGVQAMSQDIPGFVETSLNLGVIKLKDEFVKYVFATRSSVPSKKRALTKQLEMFAKQTGSDLTVTAEYPGWDFKQGSELLDKAVAVYKELYKKEPEVKGIHAGLEAGVFLEKLADADAISIGPDMMAVHSPDEKLNIESTKRTWDYLVAILKSLK